MASDQPGTLDGFPDPPATDSARQAELRPRDQPGTLDGFPDPPATDSARQAELRPRDPLVLVDLPRRAREGDFPWQPYLPGIEIHRIYGDDRGGPSAILLRYAPGASAPHHVHPSYEHIYVLSGEQSDERGVYGPGTFVVNPPGSRHVVASQQGCVVLVVKEQPVVFTEPAPKPQPGSPPASRSPG